MWAGDVGVARLSRAGLMVLIMTWLSEGTH